jgi:hypothetical protein
MAELFGVSTHDIGMHLKNLYEDAELSRETTTEEFSVVQTEGSREVQRTAARTRRESDRLADAACDG